MKTAGAEVVEEAAAAVAAAEDDRVAVHTDLRPLIEGKTDTVAAIGRSILLEPGPGKGTEHREVTDSTSLHPKEMLIMLLMDPHLEVEAIIMLPPPRPTGGTRGHRRLIILRAVLTEAPRPGHMRRLEKLTPRPRDAGLLLQATTHRLVHRVTTTHREAPTEHQKSGPATDHDLHTLRHETEATTRVGFEKRRSETRVEELKST